MMCMIDFGCYTNHSLGMSTAAEYNRCHPDRGRILTFVCDRYSVASFPEIDTLIQGGRNDLRCGLEIDLADGDRIIPAKCVAVSDKGIENLYRIVGRADGSPLRIDALRDILGGVLIGLSEGYDDPAIRDFPDFWYLTPSFSDDACRAIYEAAKACGKPLCAATNACYVNESDEPSYSLLQKQDNLGRFQNPGKWNHMMSEGEMFRRLDFLGHQAAWEILIDAPFKLLDPYWEWLNHDLSPVPWCGREYGLPFGDAVASVKEIALARFAASEYRGDKAAQTRLNEELARLLPYQAERLLLSCRISQKLRERGYRPLNKGWVGASFAAYLLGATNVDPIRCHIPWELYFSSPDPKAYSIRYVVPEAMRFSRRELLESCLHQSLILPCRYECDIPFPAKVPLGEALHDAAYPFSLPEFTCGLYESEEEWYVFPENFDEDLAKGLSTLSPRLLEGHFPIVELYVDSRMDALKGSGVSDSAPQPRDGSLEKRCLKVGEAMARYAPEIDATRKFIFAEDLYNVLAASRRVEKSDAIRLANNIRKGLYSAEKYQCYLRSHPKRHTGLLIKAGCPEGYMEDVISKIRWLCPKSEAVEEAMIELLLEKAQMSEEIGGEGK